MKELLEIVCLVFIEYELFHKLILLSNGLVKSWNQDKLIDWNKYY